MPRTPALLLTALLALPLAGQEAPAPQAPAEEPGEEPGEPGEPAGQEIDLEDTPTPELVALLADKNFATREAAMTELLQDTTLDEPAIRALLLQAKSPEQRQRLISLAQHHLVRVLREGFENQRPGDRAAVGFSHRPIPPDQNPYADRGASVITNTMPGFPGFVYLRPGDIILQINGRPCPYRSEDQIQDWVAVAITANPAGAPTTLTIGRGGREIELTFEASSISALSAFYITTSGRANLKGEYDRVWLAARERLLADLPDVEALVPQDSN